MERARSGEDARNGDKLIEGVLPGESATARVAHESLKGKGPARPWPFLGEDLLPDLQEVVSNLRS